MLSPETKLAAHFTAGELTRDGDMLGAFIPDVSPLVESNLIQLAATLESVRGALGVPLRVTSGFRPPEKNASVGGVSTSSHLDGLAADVVPVGLSQYDAYRRLETATLPPWDQTIYYPIQGHIHIGIGSRLRREIRIALSEDQGGTPLLSESLVDRLQGYVASAISVVKYNPVRSLITLLALAVGAYFLFRRWPKGA